MGVNVQQQLGCHRLWPCAVVLAGLVVHLAACSSAYYGTMEAFGVHKRDILVERVEEARDGQEEAKEQFKSALEAFTSATDFEGGQLQDVYDELEGQYEDCADRAETVRDRIARIEDVAEALFDEWELELDEYSSPDLRRRSEDALRDTRRQYDRLIDAMHDAASKMDPVLTAFHDQVLFLKHNLNAQAIASLEGDAAQLESTIADLVAEMERAIDEANTFIASMGTASDA